MAYISTIDTANKNNSHTIAIDFLVEKAKDRLLKILDVGCSEGYLGGYLKNLGHTVLGVEMNPHAAHKAGEVLDSVYNGSIGDYFTRHSDEKFDVILFGDVLEHIADPNQVLEICHNHLHRDGFIIASLPNVAHAAIRAMLLEGRWEYADLGILDRTHLRFFTRESAQALFEQADYEIQELGQVHLPIEMVDQLCNLNLSQKYIDLVNNLVSDEPDATVFQNIFLAEPKRENAVRIVAYVPNKDLSLYDIRIKNPLDNWKNRYNGRIRYRDYNEIRLDDLYWGDIFVFQRSGGEYILNLMSVLQKHGKKCVFELDDLLTEIPDFLAHHKMSPDTLNTYLEVIAKADLVTTTTQRLAYKFLKMNPLVICVPNCTESFGLPLTNQSSQTTNKVTLVVASSDRVLVDFLAPALLKIQETYPSDYDIFVIGPPGDYLENFGIKITRSDLVSHTDFKKLLSGLINPVGLIPLDDSVFSSCKSPIKFFDYALAGMPVICSNVPPYSDYIINEETGFLVSNDTDSWVTAILKLGDSFELRNLLAQRAIEYVSQLFSLNVAGDAWQSVVNKLAISRTEDLALLKPETYQVGILKTAIDANGIHLEVKMSFSRIFRQLLSPAVYLKIYRVISTEGFSGLLQRLKRI
ncbi:methyltransferase domain-containing protein [Methylobacter psychrophilus]|uniref:methyltransferase domain-containing protein n=1 Tax=Methylobacter psychrophilus TaxID=96941 RepID=UPI0021D4980A|nr:methyltransferase domain-containing protein [Methylobacter psychrophilus]